MATAGKRRGSLLLLLLVLHLLQSKAVTAAEINGVTLPQRVSVDQRSWILNGAGVRTKTLLRIKVYVLGLYLESPERLSANILARDSPRRWVVHLTHNVSRARLADELRTGVERGSPSALSALRTRLDGLMKALPAELSKGDALTFTYLPGQGTTVEGKGIAITFGGKDFADALARAWIGEDPLDPELKRAVLEGGPR